MKLTKIIMFLIAWYMTGFYVTIVVAVENSMAEHRISFSMANRPASQQ